MGQNAREVVAARDVRCLTTWSLSTSFYFYLRCESMSNCSCIYGGSLRSANVWKASNSSIRGGDEACRWPCRRGELGPLTSREENSIAPFEGKHILSREPRAARTGHAPYTNSPRARQKRPLCASFLWMSAAATQRGEIQRDESFRHQSTPMPVCPTKGLNEGCFTIPLFARCATATKQPRKLDLTDNFLNGTLSALAGNLRELEELRLDANQVWRWRRARDDGLLPRA